MKIICAYRYRDLHYLSQILQSIYAGKVILVSTKNNMVAVNIADNEFIILSYKIVLHIKIENGQSNKRNIVFLLFKNKSGDDSCSISKLAHKGLEPKFSITMEQLVYN